MRVRTKDCFKCKDQKEILYRCRYAELKDWVFICEKCLQEVKIEFEYTKWQNSKLQLRKLQTKSQFDWQEDLLLALILDFVVVQIQYVV